MLNRSEQDAAATEPAVPRDAAMRARATLTLATGHAVRAAELGSREHIAFARSALASRSP